MRTTKNSSRKKGAKQKAPVSSSASAKAAVSQKGHDLLNQVIHLSGIPAESIRRELSVILEKKNLALDNLTLEQLRTVAASYLREIMGSLLDRNAPPKGPTN